MKRIERGREKRFGEKMRKEGRLGIRVGIMNWVKVNLWVERLVRFIRGGRVNYLILGSSMEGTLSEV
ncbi:hypothetical protein [Bacillus altitudinis]|uniref:hypothetical protein n=1 Tax=Bacillus altitudinis TaxID=293387 RepID=UPI0011A1659B|nr:hypothetical protein [Bacillus altitudinis]